MKFQFYKLCTLVFTATALLNFKAAYLGASCHHQNNDLTSIARITFNEDFCDENIALGALGEVGRDNIRGNGTVGFAIQGNQSLKIGGEYLAQKLKYCFFDGHTRKWVDQWAVGIKYQAFFDHCFIDGVVADIYSSRANSKQLKKHVLSDTLQLKRFIAGSRAYGVEAGFLFGLWRGSALKLLVDYDNVKFLKHYHSDSNSNGFGWTAVLNQKLLNCLDLNLKVEMRKPFNNYSADLIFTNYSSFGFSSIGLFGRYTDGKSRVVNAWTAGIELGLSFGRGSDCCSLDCAPVTCSSSLLNWVLEPAVYMPVVLAIRDEQLKHTPPTPPIPPPCVAPAMILAFPVQIGSPVTQMIFDVSPYFEGTNLSWSAISADPAGISVTIDSSGILTATQIDFRIFTTSITVNATNECGNAQGSFFASFPSPG